MKADISRKKILEKQHSCMNRIDNAIEVVIDRHIQRDIYDQVIWQVYLQISDPVSYRFSFMRIFLNES